MHTTTRLLTALSVLVLAVLACARGSAAPTPTAVRPKPANTPAPTQVNTPGGPVPMAVLPGLDPGEKLRTLNYGGIERDYVLYVPASADLTKPLALVFALHGGTGNASQFRTQSGWDLQADLHGFLLVYPNGTGRLGVDKLLTWNGGGCCGYAQTQNIDDVGYLRTIVDSLRSQANIDPRRVYATGFSNGAILAQRLACEASDLFAAVAPVSGTLNFSSCAPQNPISLLEIHGTDDQNILYTGGYGPEAITHTNFTSVADTLKFWTTWDHCTGMERTTPAGGVQLDTWSGCNGSSAVELYTIEGGKHAWPHSPIDAAQVIWDFFAAHPKP